MKTNYSIKRIKELEAISLHLFFGENHCKSYAMYCDVVGRMTATGKIKVKVYGERWNTTKGFKLDEEGN